MTFTPMRDKIFTVEMEKGERVTQGGIIIRDDNAKDHGIRPRWSKVAAIGTDIDCVKVGEWVLLPHGRWTEGIDLTIDGVTQKTWMVDNDEILLVSETKPQIDTK